MEPISLKEREQVKLCQDQILTLIGVVTCIICNLFLKIDMMVTPICAGVVLLCLGCGDPDKMCIRDSLFPCTHLFSPYSAFKKSMANLAINSEPLRNAFSSRSNLQWCWG